MPNQGQTAYPVPPPAASLSNPVTVAQGGTGGDTAAEARENLGLEHVSLYATRIAVQPGGVGLAYVGMGLSTAPTASRAGSALSIFGKRIYGRHAPAANTDGSIIGGYNAESNNRILRAESTSAWTVYKFFGFGAQLAARGGVALAAATPTDVDKLANDCVGVRLRPSASNNLVAICVDASGNVSPGDLGVTAAADTIYVAEIVWTGTVFKIRVAVVNQTTGVFGTWSTRVTLSTNLPTSTSGLAPTTNWWCVGTPGVSPVVFIGGCVILPYAVT